MSDIISVVKDSEQQAQIPTVWRATLSTIVNAIETGDFRHIAAMPEVKPISEELAQTILENIREYGVQLKELPEESWSTSVCQWMDGYWDVLVDLYSVEEGASDLALEVRVYEVGAEYLIEVNSVHVP